MTPQQRADELLAERQAQRNIEQVMEAIVQADQQVAFYEQAVVKLLSAVYHINEHFKDRDHVTRIWSKDLEIARDVLSRLLDTAEGKLK